MASRRPPRERKPPPRLKDFDYGTPGWYFITCCVHHRRPVLSTVAGGRAIPSGVGVAVQQEWELTSAPQAGVLMGPLVVMPDHLHGLIRLLQSPHRTTLIEVMRRFKAASARAVNLHRGTLGAPVWQRSYFDRIVRNSRELRRILWYMATNPVRWAGRP